MTCTSTSVIDPEADGRDAGDKFPMDAILHPLFHDIAAAAGHAWLETHMTEFQVRVYEAVLEGITSTEQLQAVHGQLEKERRQAASQLDKERAQTAAALEQAHALRDELDGLRNDSVHATTNEVFFIRAMKETEADVDYISGRIRKICENRKLVFVDPKKVYTIGNILNQITEYDPVAAFVIADTNDDRQCQRLLGQFVDGHSPQKLILIAERSTIEKLPFDFQTKRVIHTRWGT